MDSVNLQIDSNITKDLDAIQQGQLSLFELGYNPDVLDCLSSLSNDEVFTSPKLANQMLDLLPPVNQGYFCVKSSNAWIKD